MSGLRSRIVTLISAARRAGDDLQKALSMKTVRDYDNLIREACRHLDRLGFTYAAVERSKHRGFISVGRSYCQQAIEIMVKIKTRECSNK